MFCKLALGVLEENTQAEINRIRTKVKEFFQHDAEQVTPLCPTRRVKFTDEASPATTVKSVDSNSSSMHPSKVAEWYFCHADLSPELEVVSRFPVDAGGFSGIYRGKWMNHDVAVKLINPGQDKQSTYRVSQLAQMDCLFN